MVENSIVGTIRIVDTKEPKKYKFISPIFIIKEFRCRGYAKWAIKMVEEIHGSSGWELDTILQEKGNYYLHEKMGYRQTSVTKVVNERMTIIFYRIKRMKINIVSRLQLSRTTDFSFMLSAPCSPATIDEQQ